MSSSFICKCGEKIYKNLFSGNNLSLIVPEKELVNNELSNEEINHIIMNSKIIAKCKKCKRIAIINEINSEIEFYEKL